MTNAPMTHPTLDTVGSFNGSPVRAATLASSDGVSVRILSYGCVLQSWLVPDTAGTPGEATLGFPDFASYPANAERAFGIVAGRVANRIRDGRFELGGTRYEVDRNKGPHHLHGGSGGIGRQNWTLDVDGRTARLTHTSPDGAMGYPGGVEFVVDITLDGHTVTFDMTGVPDQPTPIALAQHSYYLLGGPVSAHMLQVNGARYTEVDDLVVTTGRILDVAGTALDFRTPRVIDDTEIDINFCLDTVGAGTVAGTLEGADFRLTIATDRPGLQVYNSFDMPEVAEPGHGGTRYGPFAGVALEAQDWPGAINHAHFPPVVASPDAPYRQTTSVTIVPR